MNEDTKKMMWGLSRNGWALTAIIFIINVPYVIMSGVPLYQDPFRFFVGLGAGLIGAYIGVRILSKIWNFFTMRGGENS